MIENNNYKKWKDGDTFALKIVNCDNSFYNDKFLILNFIKRDYHLNVKYPFFRIKIVDNIDSINKKKLDNPDYIITNIFNIAESSAILDEILDENRKKADNYGYLYQYQVNILTNSKYNIPNDLIYLGNFKLNEPVNEYIPWTPHNIRFELWKDIVNESVWLYESYNLRKSEFFDKKKAEEWYNELKEVKSAAIKCVQDIRNRT